MRKKEWYCPSCGKVNGKIRSDIFGMLVCDERPNDTLCGVLIKQNNYE